VEYELHPDIFIVVDPQKPGRLDLGCCSIDLSTSKRAS
jgi:hypothetical protein